MLFEVKNLSFRYGNGPWVLREVSFSIEEGERVCLSGPSGCGKSTLASLLAGCLRPTGGEILWKGAPLPQKGYCPVQLVHQHPEKAVNPRWKLRRTLCEAWTPDEAFLQSMGIEREWLDRWPNELSGGELQRFCIARVLGPQTEFLIADETTAMLDVITQAQLWQVLLRQVEERGLGLAVVTHNAALARKTCTRLLDLPALNRAPAT